MTIEDFIKAIEEAEKIIPERPTITIKNATVTGVKLNKKMIDSIPKAEGTAPYIYDGLKVYQDDSVKKPQFIVEGEIESKKYLKWEDLFFEEEVVQPVKVKIGNAIFRMACYRYMGKKKVCIGNNYTYFELKDTEEDIQFFNDLHLERVE